MASSTITASPASPPPTTTTSSSRTGRLRGLSYLRNYTHNHLSSSSHSHSHSSSHSPSGSTSSTSNNNNHNSTSSAASPSHHRHSFLRSTSHPDNVPTIASSHATSASTSTTARPSHRVAVAPDSTHRSISRGRARAATTENTLTRITSSVSSPPDTTPPAPVQPDRQVSEGSSDANPTASLNPNSASARSRSRSFGNNSNDSAEMASRHRSSHSATHTIPANAASRSASGEPASRSLDLSSAQRDGTLSDSAISNSNSAADKKSKPPMIRFYPHQDAHRHSKPSLHFQTMTRILPSDASIIRVGRYSERDGATAVTPGEPSDAPVGFKSKVVSRKHCEFSWRDGRWQIKDVGSSSGTFLNHIRLSQPNIASKYFPVKDGDIVQLGIDFRGGEEMIFRSVKIRIECNRSWQQAPNKFNKRALENLGKPGGSEGECSICLGSVLPCQALFIAPCAHSWHYKCIRPLLTTDYPSFQCPNCRAMADLEADLDEEAALWEQQIEEAEVVAETPGEGSGPDADVSLPNSVILPDPVEATVLASPSPAAPMDVSASIDIPARPAPSPSLDPDSIQNGPLTPRNTAGPFVFDGSGERGTRPLV